MILKRLIVLICLVWSCQDNSIKKPEKLIPEDQMEDIIYDMLLIDSVKSNYGYKLSEYNFKATEYIFQKYNIDSLQWAENNLYYASKIKVYEKINNQVKLRFENQATQIDCLMVRTISEKKQKNLKILQETSNLKQQ